jgi:uncharacterized protein (TIGR02679 family)
MTDTEAVRAAWDTNELRGLWAKAREVLESANPPSTFRLELPDEQTRQAVGELYGRPMWGQGTRISVSRLDAQLRSSSFGIGLSEALEILHARPVSREEPTDRTAEKTDPVLAALREVGLGDRSWVDPWAQWLHQYGRVAEDQLDLTAQRAAAVLSQLVLDTRSPVAWSSRSDLACRFGGGSHQLDSGTTLSRLVLRAAAFAHGVDAPGNERDRRALWERCGVLSDAVSDTVLCWSLPLVGTDAWSVAFRERTELRLPHHLTHLDLLSTPQRLVEEGAAIAVCENPRVLEAAVRAKIPHPLVCASGQPTAVADQLLRRLSSDGAHLHHHGDLDWAGVAITRSLSNRYGGTPWRMSSSDYREALRRASTDRIDLPTLVGTPVATPWDPALAELMSTAGRGIDEEIQLAVLLDDLRRGLA